MSTLGSADGEGKFSKTTPKNLISKVSSNYSISRNKEIGVPVTQISSACPWYQQLLILYIQFLH